MIKLSQCVFLFVGLLVTSAFAVEDKLGFEIAARADWSKLGFSSRRVYVHSILSDTKGRTHERTLVLKTFERENEQQGDRTLIIFHTPADLSRTALLSHAQLLDDDNQWLFLKRLRRVKRISGANKSGAFVGTEFSFEDLTAQELHKFTYEWIRADKLDGADVDVIRRFPRYRRSAYSQQHVWFSREHGQPLRIDSFAKNGAARKRLILRKYKKVSGFWRAHYLHMENLQTKKTTALEFSNYEIDVGYSTRDFERSVFDGM